MRPPRIPSASRNGRSYARETTYVITSMTTPSTQRGDQREEACARQRLAAGGGLDAVFPDAGICRIEACGDGREG